MHEMKSKTGLEDERRVSKEAGLGLGWKVANSIKGKRSSLSDRFSVLGKIEQALLADDQDKVCAQNALEMRLIKR